jgi:hypothetical protein
MKIAASTRNARGISLTNRANDAVNDGLSGFVIFGFVIMTDRVNL